MANKFTYSILSSVTSGVVDSYKLSQEIAASSIIIALQSIKVIGDILDIEFKANISTMSETELNQIIENHNGEALAIAKIKTCIDLDHTNFDFRDIDYTITPKPNLFPKRTFIKGELVKAEWFKDSEFTDIVLRSDIAYTRDAFGFAASRTTTRTWFDEQDVIIPLNKVTTKNYTSSPLEQIKEGKRRRGNIVDGIQLPTMSFMFETMMVSPWNKSMNEIVLIGRDFLDRHDDYFSKFIDNSSSITDVNDPNFGKKSVVVSIEEAALTTDLWLKNKPSSIGGALSIEQYLISEFSI